MQSLILCFFFLKKITFKSTYNTWMLNQKYMEETTLHLSYSPPPRGELELTVEVCPFRLSRKVFTCINEHIQISFSYILIKFYPTYYPEFFFVSPQCNLNIFPCQYIPSTPLYRHAIIYLFNNFLMGGHLYQFHFSLYKWVHVQIYLWDRVSRGWLGRGLAGPKTMAF